MPFCKECGKPMQGPVGALCPECQKKVSGEYNAKQEQNEQVAKENKKKKGKVRGKWYNLARGIHYPITFILITLVIIQYFFLDEILANFDVSIPPTVTALSIPTDWFFSIAFIIIGVIALDHDGPSIFLTIIMLCIILPFLIGVIAVVWFAIQVFMATT